jgi:regulator of replication initiation timing
MFKPEDTRNAVYANPLTASLPASALAGRTDAPLTSTGLQAAMPVSDATAVAGTSAGVVAPGASELGPESSTAEPESEMESFKKTVSKFITTDRKIAELSKQLKALRAEQTDIKQVICKFMGDRDLEDLRTRELRLKLKTGSVKPPLKKAELHERVAEYLGGADKAEDFFEKVYNDRESVQKTSLRRLKVTK